jgi:hypothetical protein
VLYQIIAFSNSFDKPLFTPKICRLSRLACLFQLTVNQEKKQFSIKLIFDAPVYLISKVPETKQKARAEGEKIR